ncbi:precorrin-2 C(20)-methyltransferase [uncultured Aquimarina sp.]|uniref:precorrin-2 C(20)-methyltransferase n=1 Tax=uncultured Aquimarina sp. TaxID=575652 RepID=UPI0026153B9D|nr:precorrin-2 C(20)-methyltransferase [uncultured Aquimarina sp.]
MIKKEAIIYGISLGPGDPDLITVKGLNVLKKVDVIYYPGSLFSNGIQSSYSLSILEYYQLDKNKLKGFFLEMNLERVQAKVLYSKTYKEIENDYNAGLKIAVVSEGDINTFSSFSYLLEKMQANKLNVELIPGITSYALSASEHKSPLCLQNEKLIILPRVQTAQELEEALTYFDTVVLMKIKSVMEVINTVVDKGGYKIWYSERLGTKKQFTTSHWETIMRRTIPYFSLITIKK